MAGRLFGDRGEPVQCGALGGDGAFELVDPPVALADAFVVGALQGGESLDLVFEFDLLDVAWVAGGDRFGFGGGGSDVSPTEVFDFVVDDFVAAHLLDEQRLWLEPSATSRCRS